MNSSKNNETLTRAVASLPPEQMFELMKQMKLCIQNNPVEAKQMLLQNSQLAYALLQAQVVMRIVNPHTTMSLLEAHAKDPSAFEVTNAASSSEPAAVSSSNAQTKSSVTSQPSTTVATLVSAANTNRVVAPNTTRANNNPLSLVTNHVASLSTSTSNNATQSNSLQPASLTAEDVDMRMPPTNSADEDLRIPLSQLSATQMYSSNSYGNLKFQQPSDSKQQQQLLVQKNAPSTSSRVISASSAINNTTTTYSMPPPSTPTPATARPQPASASRQQPTTTPTTIAKSGSDSDKAALIMQVLQLTEQQINALPAEQRQSIIALKEQIAKSAKLR